MLSAVASNSLHTLASRFRDWRQTTEVFMQSRLEKLPSDDPLRCPISLFGTLDFGRLETAHTRALAWLLDPKREHGFGLTLVRAILDHLGDKRNFSVNRVMSEHPIQGGRIDVLAEGTWTSDGRGWVLLIEAKIDAGEGQDQLRRYENWLQSYAVAPDRFRIFLTPNGDAPEFPEDDWVPLSYSQLVRVFRSAYDELRDTAGFHFLRFYLAGVLQDVCHWPRELRGPVADPYAVADYLRTLDNST